MVSFLPCVHMSCRLSPLFSFFSRNVGKRGNRCYLSSLQFGTRTFSFSSQLLVKLISKLPSPINPVNETHPFNEASSPQEDSCEYICCVGWVSWYNGDPYLQDLPLWRAQTARVEQSFSKEHLGTWPSTTASGLSQAALRTKWVC